MTIPSKKHWSSQSEAARDEVKDAFAQALGWILLRRREVAYTAAGAAVAALVLGLLVYQRRLRINDAWDKLSQAEIYAYSGRPQDAQNLIAQVADAGASPTVAALARLLEGDLRYPRGEFDQALAAYDKAAQSAPQALLPYALAEKIMTLEAAGKAADCAAAAQSFLDANVDHLLTAQVHTNLARCQLAQGQTAVARATLQRISLQYPSTPWAEWAGARLQTLPK